MKPGNTFDCKHPNSVPSASCPCIGTCYCRNQGNTCYEDPNPIKSKSVQRRLAVQQAPRTFAKMMMSEFDDEIEDLLNSHQVGAPEFDDEMRARRKVSKPKVTSNRFDAKPSEMVAVGQKRIWREEENLAKPFFVDSLVFDNWTLRTMGGALFGGYSAEFIHHNSTLVE